MVGVRVRVEVGVEVVVEVWFEVEVGGGSESGLAKVRVEVDALEILFRSGGWVGVGGKMN